MLAALRLRLDADGLLIWTYGWWTRRRCAPRKARPARRWRCRSRPGNATTRRSSSPCVHKYTYGAARGYDAQHIRRWLRRRCIRAVIPRRRPAKGRCRRWRGRPPRIEPRRFARRNVIERFFGSLKEHRRVATRYDKHDTHFLSMVQVACIRPILQLHFSDTD